MRLKEPSFWYRSSIWSTLLTPASYAYLLGHKLHQTKTPYKSKLPVLCIGNAVVGGSGKTPAALALIDIIKEHNLAKNPVILTRGYGGNLMGPVLVDLNKHSFHDVGDEALLLARKAPTIVSAGRAQGAEFIEDMSGADIIIMDDGMQNPSLHKDINIVMVDGNRGFGNGKLFPAGPLREPLDDITARADAFIAVGSIPASPTIDKPILTANIKTGRILESGCYIGFAGIAHPKKFKDSLSAQSVTLAGWHAFPDHYPYRNRDLKSLLKEAQSKNAQLITTEKDYVRIPAAFQKDVATLPVTLVFKNANRLLELLKEKLTSTSLRGSNATEAIQQELDRRVGL